MAKTITPLEGYALITQVARQATGQESFAAVNASTFVSAGETILATGTENVLNAVNIVLNRLVLAVRPYPGKFLTVQETEGGVFSNRVRKVSFYSKDALPSGYFNTDQFTNLAEGYTSGDNGGVSTKSQWEQHQPMPLEMNFVSNITWQKCITEYENQVKIAIRSIDEWTRFVEGYLQEHANDITTEREAFTRMTVLAKMANIYDNAVNNTIAPESAVNLTAAFNAYFNPGTPYTTADLLSTYLKEFTEFAVATIKEYSDRLTDRSARFHDPMAKTVGADTFHILRHTPKSEQRLILYGPLMKKVEAMVMPEVFGPNYLELGENYESVNYWQVNDGTNDMAINFTSAVYDHVTGTQIAGNNVQLDNVVGILFDRDALLTTMQLEVAHTTPIEARKGYRNTWLTYNKGAIIDQTENAILFYMAD
ncbi:MAG: hypothetical protein J6R32_02405 [Bacteroidales bacterium]|nr:hypothetical protein [Bacteroidales bacterium]